MRRVLALRVLGLGDLLTMVPALRALRRDDPESLLVLAGPAVLGEWARSLGLVDDVVDTHDLSSLAWRGPPPDLAVNFHGRGPQSHALLQALGPDALLAYACPSAGHRAGPVFDPDEHEVDRWIRLARWGGMPCGREDLRLSSPRHGVGGHVIVHPGASTQSRRWPGDRWSAVAARLAADGHEVIITGSASEAPLCERLAHGTGIESRCGAWGLDELAESVADAALLICGDTGPAHLATAFATPSVLLFGPIAPAHWGPAIDDDLPHVIWHPRLGDTASAHTSAVDERLLRIEPGEVLEAARTMIATGRG